MGEVVTPKSRYQHMLDLYGEVGRRAPVCGMHVHVGIDDDDEGVRVLDQIQPWLPVLVALSANSPFDHGVDTSYASWREQVWDGWPSTGPVEPFVDADGYHRAVQRLVDSGAVIDKAMVYFDARLAEHYDTVEIRVADVCTDIDDALVVAALTRALVETTAATESTDEPWRIEMLRAGRWLARRYGVTGALLDPRTAEPRPAREVVELLLDHVAEALRQPATTRWPATASSGCYVTAVEPAVSGRSRAMTWTWTPSSRTCCDVPGRSEAARRARASVVAEQVDQLVLVLVGVALDVELLGAVLQVVDGPVLVGAGLATLAADGLLALVRRGVGDPGGLLLRRARPRGGPRTCQASSGCGSSHRAWFGPFPQNTGLPPVTPSTVPDT